MSEDILQFLKSKFMNDLQEVEEEEEEEDEDEEESPVEEIPLRSYFQEIRAVLEGKSMTPLTPIRMKDCLYNLCSTLEDCVIFLEKRKRQIKEGGPSRGRYSLPERWFLCKRRRKLLQIKKKLLHTSDGAESSSSSFARDDRRGYYLGFHEQEKKIQNWLADRTGCNDGSVKKLGIIGVGGSGKTALMRSVIFHIGLQALFHHVIGIGLSETLSGDIDFEEILKDMLKQCDDNIDCKDCGVEELLELLYKLLSGKSYLIVFDGVWDINLDWFFRLGSKLEWDQNSKEKPSRCVIITTRLPSMARKMVGSKNLHHMLPLDFHITNELMTMCEPSVRVRSPIWCRIGEEIIEQCHGLPLATETLKRIILGLTVGKRYTTKIYLPDRLILILMDCKEDDMLAIDLLQSYDSVTSDVYVRSQVAHDHDQLAKELKNLLLDFRRRETSYRRRLRILIFGGDAVVNRLVQALCDTEDDDQPPIAHIPLGIEANISVSLGWVRKGKLN